MNMTIVEIIMMMARIVIVMVFLLMNKHMFRNKGRNCGGDRVLEKSRPAGRQHKN